VRSKRWWWWDPDSDTGNFLCSDGGNLLGIKPSASLSVITVDTKTNTQTKATQKTTRGILFETGKGSGSECDLT